jgi:DtxR family Mn-dependent transcriptional regulator
VSKATRIPTSAVEDYLKAIYQLQGEGEEGRASTSSLAERLGVARASVTGMLKKLAAWKPRLVEYARYRGVRLTPAGEKIALEVIRHHRLIESYLHEALDYSWDEVHREADRLEHVISEAFEDRIAAKLGHPETDPHGDPIPERDGSLPERDEIRLTQLPQGQAGAICRVADDPDLLRYLAELGLKLGAKIEVTEVSPLDGPVHVRQVGAQATHALGRKVTDRVFVRPHVARRRRGSSNA